MQRNHNFNKPTNHVGTGRDLYLHAAYTKWWVVQLKLLLASNQRKDVARATSLHPQHRTSSQICKPFSGREIRENPYLKSVGRRDSDNCPEG